MDNDQGRLIQSFDGIGHDEGLAGASNAKKGLKLISFLETFYKLGNSLGLIADGFIFGY